MTVESKMPGGIVRIVGEPMVLEEQETPQCPRCSAGETVSLDKVDAVANTCYRCRGCGHIFSPRT